MNDQQEYLPYKTQRYRLYLSTEKYKSDGLPRPREAGFLPNGTRKDIKVRMHHKLS